MRALPLVPDGCTLSPGELAVQLERAARVAPAVTSVARSERAMRVSFAAGVDRGVIDELVAIEHACCSFLDVSYDGDERALSVASDDLRGREVLQQLAAAFERGHR